MTVEVFVGIGSNIDRERHVRAGVAALRDAFGALRVSSVWDCPAVGFDGADFLNLVVAFDTDLDVREVARMLDGIEAQAGRPTDAKGRKGSRTLDLDLLLYGDARLLGADVRVPRADVLECAHVLKPLAELAPERRHPVDGRTYRQLWGDYTGARDTLKRHEMEI
jgi:2-amino-4-hydroxy-6-hydroxymethyldihydropteridine diphosphokinase